MELSLAVYVMVPDVCPDVCDGTGRMGWYRKCVMVRDTCDGTAHVGWGCRAFSLAECILVPALERFAANLPLARGFKLRGNPQFPNLARWYEAMDARPTYQRLKSDDTTHNLVVR